MKICVECASKSNWNNIINTLEKNIVYKCSFVGNDKIRPLSLIFNVESMDSLDDTIKNIKTMIKSTDYGKSIMFRVVPYGKLVYFS